LTPYATSARPLPFFSVFSSYLLTLIINIIYLHCHLIIIIYIYHVSSLRRWSIIYVFLLCRYGFVLLRAKSFVCHNSCVLSCVPFCLWTMPSRRSREPVLVHCDREFALPWP
jgi:hypothetical protein